MLNRPTEQDTQQGTPAVSDYEPPRIETMMTPETLEHEVMYALSVVSPITD